MEDEAQHGNEGEDIEALLERARRGDHQALEIMVERYRPLLQKNSRRAYRAGVTDSEDLFQESAKQFLELVQEYMPERQVSFGAYIKTKHAWRMANYARRECARSSRVQALEEMAGEPVDWRDPLQSVASVDVRDALATLTRRQREVLVRYHVLEQSAERIAQRMGIGIRAVHSLKRRAELRLREELRD